MVLFAISPFPFSVLWFSLRLGAYGFTYSLVLVSSALGVRLFLYVVLDLARLVFMC